MIENSSAGHLLYTNRWNLHKAPRFKGEPLSPFTQVGIYFTASIEPALSGWWRAKGRAQFWAQFSDQNNFRAETARDSQNVWRRGCHSYWGATLSDLATGRILSRALSFVVVIYVTHRHNRWPTKEKKPRAKQSGTGGPSVKSTLKWMKCDLCNTSLHNRWHMWQEHGLREKNVSQWIFFEIGRWWCVDWESRSSKSGY